MRQPKPLPLRGQGIASRSCATETTRHGLGEHAPPQHGAPNTAARPRCPLQTLQQRRHALARRPAHARRGRRRRRGRASARAQAGHPARRARRRRSGHGQLPLPSSSSPLCLAPRRAAPADPPRTRRSPRTASTSGYSYYARPYCRTGPTRRCWRAAARPPRPRSTTTPSAPWPRTRCSRGACRRTRCRACSTPWPGPCTTPRGAPPPPCRCPRRPPPPPPPCPRPRRCRRSERCPLRQRRVAPAGATRSTRPSARRPRPRCRHRPRWPGPAAAAAPAAATCTCRA